MKDGAEPLRAVEQWFIRNGLTYFVPSERDHARVAPSPRKTAPVMALVASWGSGHRPR